MLTPTWWAERRILITGGTGFVGRHLTHRLRQLGVQDVVSIGSRDVNLTSTDATMHWARSLAGRFNLLFHMASWTQPGTFCLQHPAEQFLINNMIHTNVLRAWHECFPQARLIGIGASCEYPGRIFHMREEDLLAGEPHPSLLAYAMTKRMLYAGQRAYAQQYHLDTVHVIFATLYGPEDYFDEARSHVVSALIDRFMQATARRQDTVVVWGDGYQTRECIYIDDQIDGLLLVAERGNDPLMNLGTGVSHTVREIAETIADLCGFQGRIVYDAAQFVGIRHKVLNIDRARSALGWHPQITLREGLRRTIAWYEQHVLPLRLQRDTSQAGTIPITVSE